MNSVRKTLCDCGVEVILEFLKLLDKYKIAADETIRVLLSTSKMRELLAGEQWWLARLRLKNLLKTRTELRQNGARRRAVADRSVSRALLTQYNREELYERVWALPMRALAKDFGISDVGLAKVCKKLFIPVPGRGYWAKKAAGLRVPPKPALLSIQIR